MRSNIRPTFTRQHSLDLGARGQGGNGSHAGHSERTGGACPLERLAQGDVLDQRPGKESAEGVARAGRVHSRDGIWRGLEGHGACQVGRLAAKEAAALAECDQDGARAERQEGVGGGKRRE